MRRIKRNFLLAAMVLSLFVQVHSASATTVTTNNVGDLTSNAYTLPGGTTQIVGVLTAGADADLYRFEWNTGNFAASTSAENALFLFDSTGQGLWASGFQGSSDPITLAISNLTGGTYFLGVSNGESSTNASREPIDDVYGVIFPWFGFGSSPPVAAWDPSFPLTGWDGTSVAGNYVINLSPTAVPIPAAAWLLGSGLIGLVALKRKFQR
jgi:hypothetical protein